MRVAVGQPVSTVSIVYSYDGLTWYSAPNTSSIFSSQGWNIAWNGTMWVAVGEGTAFSIAWSLNGLEWTGVINSKTLFSGSARGIVWSGTRWVAVGTGTNSTAYSDNGTTWFAGTNIFSTGSSVAWNGRIFVAVGTATGGNTIAWSSDGAVWTSVGAISGVTGDPVAGVCWAGTRWIAGGSNAIAYSNDGLIWTSATNPFTGLVRGCGWNAGLPQVTINNSSLALNSYGLGTTPMLKGSNLDIVAPPYYNTGYTNFSATFTPS
jgi:hypothetical protein